MHRAAETDDGNNIVLEPGGKVADLGSARQWCLGA